jgi:transcriptional regulator GlxA family with amidase domain
MRRRVALLLFDEVEVLDFAGPFEVFAVTDELADHRLFDVATVGLTSGAIRARNGLRVFSEHTLETSPPPDILIVPGGFGTRALLKNSEVITWIQTKAATAEVVLSVCTGSLLLGKAGLLDGLRATTHHECFELLEAVAPKAIVARTDRFTDNGKVCTSGGIAAGIDLSLHIVERLHGAAVATRTANYMEYERR